MPARRHGGGRSDTNGHETGGRPIENPDAPQVLAGGDPPVVSTGREPAPHLFVLVREHWWFDLNQARSGSETSVLVRVRLWATLGEPGFPQLQLHIELEQHLRAQLEVAHHQMGLLLV